jgi:hypothetical protein
MKTVEEHYQTLLEVTSPWDVRHVAEYVESREVRIAIRLRAAAQVDCPRCARLSSVLPDSGERKRVESTLLHYKLIIDCPKLTATCEAHGNFSVPTPLARLSASLFSPERIDSDESESGCCAAENTVIIKQHLRKFTLLGKEYPCANAMDAVLQILNALAQNDATFLERLSRHPNVRGKKRNYIARTPEELYDNPGLRSYREPLPGAWLIGANISNDTKEKIIRAASDIARLEYGRDIVANF